MVINPRPQLKSSLANHPVLTGMTHDEGVVARRPVQAQVGNDQGGYAAEVRDLAEIPPEESPANCGRGRGPGFPARPLRCPPLQSLFVC